MPAKKTNINLLPQEEFATTPLGRFLGWLTTTFRVLIIITQIVVVGVFFSRFWLDAKISDLNELLRAKEAEVLSYQEFEKDFKQKQEQIQIFKDITTREIPKSEIIMTLTSYLPLGANFKNITIQENQISLSGRATNEDQISTFITNLESDKNFKNVTITSIGSQEDAEELLFNIKLEIRNR